MKYKSCLNLTIRCYSRKPQADEATSEVKITQKTATELEATNSRLVNSPVRHESPDERETPIRQVTTQPVRKVEHCSRVSYWSTRQR